jgi:membrane protein DedA with SNARE-associated domain
MIKQIIKIFINILNALFVIFTLALFLIAIFKKEWFEMFIEWMKWEIAWLGMYNYLIVFTSAFIEAFPVIWVVVPGQNILLIVGWFFGEISYQNLIYVIIITSFWAIIWNYVWFLLGKKYGDSFFEKYWVRFGIGKTEVKYLKVWIDKWWALGITLWKFHPMTRSFLPFIAGTMGMKSKKFMIYNALWSIIRASTIVIFWVIFAQYYKIFLEHSGKISLAIFAIIAGYIYYFKKEAFIKYWKEKNLEMEELSKK